MKKIICIFSSVSIILATLFCCLSLTNNVAYAEEDIAYRSLYVIDYNTGTVIKAINENDKYPIASMVKIMTLNLVFDEISKGNLDINEKITISDTASGMGGSQMFLEANDEYTVSDLIKGVVICSANDAATALGERISGSIDAFVTKMNAYAKEIGMNNTLFCNATGLPYSGEQYSTAKDVTIMMQKLLSHDEYYRYAKIWMEDYTHPDGRITGMVNTNKLVRFMPECDGGKTGYTKEAGFCLSATAKSGNTRIISTLLGGKDSKSRFNAVSSSLKEALSKYETKIIVKKGEVFTQKVDVKNANSESLEFYCGEDLTIFGEKNKNAEYKVTLKLNSDLQAPLKKDSEIGTITLHNTDGSVIKTAKVYLNAPIDKISYLDSLQKIIRHWSIGRK